MAKLLTLTFLLGCQAISTRDNPQIQPAPVVRSDDELIVRFHMYRHFDASRAIERLLVRGNLDDAQALARSMASVPEPVALEPWARQLALVRERAAALAGTQFVDEACQRAASLSEACARCHLDTDAVATFVRPPEAPLDQPTIDARMARHRWAADRLWEGMVGYADGPWGAGLDVLAETPLPFRVIGTERIMLATRLQQLADEARRRQPHDTLAERTQTYGEILSTCAECHAVRASDDRSPTDVVGR